MEGNLLFYTSFVFFINVYIAFIKNYITYALLFFILGVTSLFVHYPTDNETIKRIDKFFAYFLVVYGAYILSTKIYDLDILSLSFIVSTFLCVVYLYIYGYYTKQYSHDPIKERSHIFHGIVHVISAIGHGGIILF